MTKEETKECIKVMQDYVDGKSIIYSHRFGGSMGNASGPCWDWEDYKYTTKKEPKLRTWKPEEVPMFALLKITGSIVMIQDCVYHNRLGKWLIRIACPALYNAPVSIYTLDALTNPNFQYSVDGGVTWLPCGAME